MEGLAGEEGIALRFEAYNGMQRHPVANDYALGRGAVAERFDYSSVYAASVEAWSERSDWLDRDRERTAQLIDRRKAAEAVVQYNRKYNDVPEAIAAAERLSDPKALVVVGGQQAGLFTGPMLVIYKAITILQTARQAEAKLGRPVVPMFWIAGEDHDWDEANHTYVLSPQLDIRKLTVAHPEAAALPARRTSVSRTALSADTWAEPLQALSEALQDTEFKPGLIDALTRIGDRSETLSEAFAMTMSLLFGKHGLVLIDSDDAALREAEGPMFAELIRRQSGLSDALKSGELAVTESGYPLQAEASNDGLQLFLFHEGERKLLFRDGTYAVDRKSTFRMPMETLAEHALATPADLSNNALTRPLMQEALFPTLATVLGPSEIAYWSVLKEAFHLFGMRTPIIVPRQEFTLLEGTVQRQMEKFGLTFADAWERLEALRDDWLTSQDKLGLTARFTSAKETFTEVYQPLVEASASINQGLRKLGETNMGKILEQIDFLQNKSIDAMKQQHEAGLRHWERIRLTVSPLGKPQERVYNVFQYINRYGFEWLDSLVKCAVIDFQAPYRVHDVVYL
jgi:bacillithiol biosynthesis cysteine-adding enzyme BshC